MPKPEITINTTAYAVVTKTVKKSGHAARVYLDKTWADREVMVLLMQPPREKHSVENDTRVPEKKITDPIVGSDEIETRNPIERTAVNAVKMVGKRIG